MEPLSLGIAVAGLATSIIGGLMGANARRQAMLRQARFEQAQAAIAMQDTAYQVWRQRESNAQSIGAAKVAMAAGGGSIQDGSAHQTLEQMSFMDKLQQQIAEVQGNRVAWTHLQRAKLLRAGVSDLSSAEIVGSLSAGVNFAGSVLAIGKSPGPAKSALLPDDGTN